MKRSRPPSRSVAVDRRCPLGRASEPRAELAVDVVQSAHGGAASGIAVDFVGMALPFFILNVEAKALEPAGPFRRPCTRAPPRGDS